MYEKIDLLSGERTTFKTEMDLSYDLGSELSRSGDRNFLMGAMETITDGRRSLTLDTGKKYQKIKPQKKKSSKRKK